MPRFAAISAIGLMSACLAIYGVVSFEDSEVSDQLQSSKGWKQFIRVLESD